MNTAVFVCVYVYLYVCVCIYFVLGAYTTDSHNFLQNRSQTDKQIVTNA